MSSGIEVTDVVDDWLYSTLSGDPTLSALVDGRITNDEYPAEWTNPLVTFDMSSTRDVIGVSGIRIAVHAIYVVKVIGEGSSYVALAPIARRVDALLSGETGVAADTGTGHVECHREAVVRYSEALAGVRYRHLGAMYRIYVTT